jgi:hypothetical protein
VSIPALFVVFEILFVVIAIGEMKLRPWVQGLVLGCSQGTKYSCVVIFAISTVAKSKVAL